MTPLLVILAVFAVLGTAGLLMRRSRRDWLATRDYHRALDTLGQLNEATPAVEQSSPAREEPEVALPGPARRARELEASNGVANAAEHYPVLEVDDDPVATPRGGVRVLGPRNGSAGTVPAEVRRIDSDDWVAEITRNGADNHPAPARKGAKRQAPKHAAPEGETPKNRQVTNYQPPEAGELPESGDADPEQGRRGAAGRSVVVFGAEDEPPGRNKALAPAGASVMVRPAHLRRNRHRGRKVAGTAAVTVIVAAAVVGGLDVTGKINLMSRGSGKTPVAVKKPVTPHPKLAALPTTTLPATTTTVPAPTTTLPAFTLVSNTGGTAMYHVGTPGASVVISATAPCWVDAHQTNEQGTDVYTATMAAGQSETLHAPVWIRFGLASVVTITVNGKPLPAFSSPGQPYDLQLQ